MVMALALLNIASTAAFGEFVALASLALFSPYLIAIGCMLYARLSK
jgi:choline transport protein